MRDQRTLMIQNNPVAHALDVVGDGWTMLILRESFRGAKRFDDWLNRLGIARSVLARRLRTLCEAGLYDRVAYQSHPPRHDYLLTAMGRDLFMVGITVNLWEQTWSRDFHPRHAIRIVQRTDGRTVEPVMSDPADPARALTARDVEAIPGPGIDHAPAMRGVRRRQSRAVVTGGAADTAPMDLALETIGSYWTNQIVTASFFGVTRFDGFMESIEVSTSVLAERLERLIADGLLERRLYQARPARHEYHRTEAGRALYQPMLAFYAWGARWLCQPGRLPVVLMSRRTGRPFIPALHDALTGEPLERARVRAAPLHAPSSKARQLVR